MQGYSITWEATPELNRFEALLACGMDEENAAYWAKQPFDAMRREFTDPEDVKILEALKDHL